MDAIISCPGHEVAWRKGELRSHEYRYRSEAENVTCIINDCAKTLTNSINQKFVFATLISSPKSDLSILARQDNVARNYLTMDAPQVRRSAVVGDDETRRSNGETSLSQSIVVSVIPTTKTQDSSRLGLLPRHAGQLNSAHAGAFVSRVLPHMEIALVGIKPHRIDRALGHG